MATGPSSFSVSRNRGCRVGVGVKNAEHSSRGKYKCCQGEGGPRPHRRGKGGSGRSVCGGWTGKRGKGVGGCVCTGQGGRAGGSRAFAPICACAENETKGMTPRGKQEVGARGQAHRPTPKPGLNTPRTRPQAPFPSPRPPGTGLPPPKMKGSACWRQSKKHGPPLGRQPRHGQEQHTQGKATPTTQGRNRSLFLSSLFSFPLFVSACSPLY